MIKFVRYNRCRGLTLGPIARRQLEFWAVPSAECVPPHTHLQMEGWLGLIWGRMWWFMGEKEREFGPADYIWAIWRGIYHFIHVPRGTSHGFHGIAPWSLFVAYEKWHATPTSASVDFHPCER